MAIILLSWTVISTLLAGTGLLVRRAFGLRDLDASSLWESFWMGLAVCLLALQVWHFFLPVDRASFAILALSGSAGLILARRQLWHALARLRVADKVALGATVVFWAWLANRAMSPPLLVDTGIYHMPVVEWSKAYAIIPGLGNLHGRLAFNNSNLLLDALLDRGLWDGRAEHIAGGLFLFVFAPRCIAAGVRLARRTARPLDGFDFVLLVPVVLLALRHHLVSFSPDLAVTATALAAASVLYAWLTERGADPVSRDYQLLVAITLLVTAVTMKLTIFGFAGTAAVIGCVVWLREQSGSQPRRKLLLWAVALGAAITVAWLARGVMFSGFPAYPSTALGVDVGWGVPALQAHAEHAWTLEFGRISGLYYMEVEEHGWWWTWMRSLFRTGPRGTLWSVAIPVLFAGLMGLMALRRRAARDNRTAQRRGSLLLVAALIGLAFWVGTTAIVRHGLPVAWILAATAAGQFLGSSGPSRSSLRQTALLVGGSAILLAAILQFAVRRAVLDEVPRWAAAGGLITRPAGGLGLHPAHVPEVRSYVTDSGLVLSVPIRDNQCLRTPPPCTPHPAPNLRLRVEGDLAGGFVTDGVWRQTRWPNPWSDFKERFLKDREAAPDLPGAD